MMPSGCSSPCWMQWATSYRIYPLGGTAFPPPCVCSSVRPRAAPKRVFVAGLLTARGGGGGEPDNETAPSPSSKLAKRALEAETRRITASAIERICAAGFAGVPHADMPYVTTSVLSGAPPSSPACCCCSVAPMRNTLPPKIHTTGLDGFRRSLSAGIGLEGRSDFGGSARGGAANVGWSELPAAHAGGRVAWHGGSAVRRAGALRVGGVRARSRRVWQWHAT